MDEDLKHLQCKCFRFSPNPIIASMYLSCESGVEARVQGVHLTVYNA